MSSNVLCLALLVARYRNVTRSLAFADALIVVSTFSINGSNMFSSLSNAALSIRETLFWIPLYPLRQVPRLEFHRNPTVAALLSKGVSSNFVSFYVFASPTANRWQLVTPDVFFFYTFVAYSRHLVKHSTFNSWVMTGWRLTSTARGDGSWRAVMTGCVSG